MATSEDSFEHVLLHDISRGSGVRLKQVWWLTQVYTMHMYAKCDQNILRGSVKNNWELIHISYVGKRTLVKFGTCMQWTVLRQKIQYARPCNV